MANKLQASFRFYLHFLEATSAYYALCQEKNLHPSDRWDMQGKMIDAIGRLSNCIQTCDGHTAWAEFEVKAITWEGMQSEVIATKAKVERILARYTKGRVCKCDE